MWLESSNLTHDNMTAKLERNWAAQPKIETAVVAPIVESTGTILVVCVQPVLSILLNNNAP